MMIRARVLVSGRVQGVFFRSETQNEAIKQGLTGWVQNLSDGRVEAVLEGEKEKVDKLIKFCRQGPRGAIVTDIEIKWENYTGEFREFRIRYNY